MPTLSAALTLLVATASAEPSWRPNRVIDGIRVELRDVAGTSFPEIRLTTVRPGELQRLCDAVFPRGRRVAAEGRFRKQEVLRESERERWTYEQVAASPIADRDYVMHVTLEQPASSGRCEVSFATQSDPARLPPKGCVRLNDVHGHWSLRPFGPGKVAITYLVFSDPGGLVPAFLARGGQINAAVNSLETILARAATPARSDAVH